MPAGVQVIERGWLSANVVVLSGHHNRAVIDSGYCSHAAQTVALVQSALGTNPPDFLINTHLHSDHCGGNAALQAKFPSLLTLIPPGHAHFVKSWDPVALSYQPTGQNCPQFSFQGLLIPGKEVLLGDKVWEIHAAAGHDPHAVILFQRASRTLVSGDALWENGFGIVFPELDGDDAFQSVASTLDLISGLSPLSVIPGHGPVFVYSEAVIARARTRLAAFVANPTRHANHAAKVLLKFKLLELQSEDMSLFISWALKTPYLELVRARFFTTLIAHEWIDQLIDELVASGAARCEGAKIINS